MTAEFPNFSLAEYEARLTKTRQEMSSRNLDAMVVIDPSNMNWLTGYDGWSFYVHQCVVVTVAGGVFWFGRKQDAAGALRTVHLADRDVLYYPEACVQTPNSHPMEFLGGVLSDRGFANAVIGFEMDHVYASAAGLEALKSKLPNARFVDASRLVNRKRAVKSPAEIGYMRNAGKIVAAMHRRAAELMAPGVKRNVLAAEIYKTALAGVDGIGGDYPAIPPLLPPDVAASPAPLVWSQAPLKADEPTSLRLSGCFKRYHCPVTRSVVAGRPAQSLTDAEAIALERMAAALGAAKPGNTGAEVLAACRSAAPGEPDRSLVHAVGLGYPPDWDEESMDQHDRAPLEEGMTLHLAIGQAAGQVRYEIAETIVITKSGCDLLADAPQRMLVKQ